MAHLGTINSDGSPHATVIWVGLDGDELVSTHMRDNVKLRNIRRDPRVVLSFDVPREPGVWINPYAVIYATATVEPSIRIWELMTKHAKVYVSPDAEVPQPRRSRAGIHCQVLNHANRWHRPMDDNHCGLTYVTKDPPQVGVLRMMINVSILPSRTVK